MKTFHEWLGERKAKNEGLWLNDKNAVPGLSHVTPIKVKPKPPQPFRPTPPATGKAKVVKVVILKPKASFRKPLPECIDFPTTDFD